MSTLKTLPNDASAEDFINAVPKATKKEDSFTLLKMFMKITGEKPKMWGLALIGFGNKVIRYESGRELDWMRIGFSPRKANLTLYLTDGVARHPELLKKLGKHKNGVGCLYIKTLSDIDLKVLEKLISASLKNVK